MNKKLPEHIFICGFMGTGKSTLGEALAKQLERPFHDLDIFIEEREGQSIAAIFETEGEKKFRLKERAALLDAIRDKKGVIALGGGTLQNQHVVDHLKVNGLLVFIDTPMDVIIDRITRQAHRPLLLDEKEQMKPKALLKKELQLLYKRRLPFYEQAEVTVKTADYSSRNNLINELIKKIRYHVALH